jgi:beta-phosphoglucomutase-like phosphatase (HAD superfamily)
MIKGCIFDLFEVILKDINALENNTIKSKSLTQDDLTDGFLVFLKELKNKGIQVAVVSNHPHLKEVLDRLRITHLINVYLSNNQYFTIENQMNKYLEAAKLMNINPIDILLFKKADGIVLQLIEQNFRIIYVGSVLPENEEMIQINDFSNLKFNQIISLVSNYK